MASIFEILRSALKRRRFASASVARQVIANALQHRQITPAQANELKRIA